MNEIEKGDGLVERNLCRDWARGYLKRMDGFAFMLILFVYTGLVIIWPSEIWLAISLVLGIVFMIISDRIHVKNLESVGKQIGANEHKIKVLGYKLAACRSFADSASMYLREDKNGEEAAYNIARMNEYYLKMRQEGEYDDLPSL